MRALVFGAILVGCALGGVVALPRVVSAETCGSTGLSTNLNDVNCGSSSGNSSSSSSSSGCLIIQTDCGTSTAVDCSKPENKLTKPECNVTSTRVSQMTLADQALSYAYVNALRLCVRDKKINDNNDWDAQSRINESDIQSGDWFRKDNWTVVSPSGPEKAHASYLAPGVDAEHGEVLCNDVVKAGTTLWGYSSPFELACTFITKRVNGSSCASGNGDFGKDELTGHQDALYAAIKNKVYGGTDPTLKDPKIKNITYEGYPGLYLIYKAAFDGGCSPKESANPSPDFAYHVTIVNDDGTTSQKTYEGVKYDTMRYVYTGGDLTEVNESCRTIESRMNEYATAYAKYRNDNQNEQPAPTGTGVTSGDGSSSGTSCNVEGVGWMICPILTFGAKLADGAYGFLADNFLSVNTSILATDPNATTTNADGATVKTGNGTYVAWGIMRTIANVAFVIAFLIIIFSQLSNVAVSNYGVKKMLPRLIFAAIFVNLSFFVCQIVVDLANITGYGLKSLLAGVADQVTAAGAGTAVNAGDESGHLGGIVATVLTAGTLVYFNLGAIVLAVIAGLIVLLTVFVLLFVRQALIVLLIVVAPLAFVAYLLPNTEPLFQKWRKMFTALLLLFPIIGLLYGACLLASAILMQVAGDNVVMKIAAYIALVVPLIAIIPLLRGSLNAVPAIGNAIGKLGGKTTGWAQGGAKKAVDNSRFSQFRRYRQGEAAKRRALIQSGQFEGSNTNPLNWGRNARSKVNRGINAVTGDFGNRATAEGIALANKADAEAIGFEEQKIRRDSARDPGAAEQALRTAIKSGDANTAKAAQNILFAQGASGMKAFHSAITSSEADGSLGSGVSTALRENINANHGQMAKTKAADISKWAGIGGNSLQSFSNGTAKDQEGKRINAWDGLSQADMAGQTGDSLQRAVDTGQLDGAVAKELILNNQLSGNLDAKQKAALQQASGVGTPRRVGPIASETTPPTPPGSGARNS